MTSLDYTDSIQTVIPRQFPAVNNPCSDLRIALCTVRVGCVSTTPRLDELNFCTAVELTILSAPARYSCHTLKVSNSQPLTAPRRRPTLPSVWQVEERMVLGGRKRYGRYREKHFIFSNACGRVKSAAWSAPHPHCRRDSRSDREEPEGCGGGKWLYVQGAGGDDSITFSEQPDSRLQ